MILKYLNIYFLPTLKKWQDKNSLMILSNSIIIVFLDHGHLLTSHTAEQQFFWDVLSQSTTNNKTKKIKKRCKCAKSWMAEKQETLHEGLCLLEFNNNNFFSERKHVFLSRWSTVFKWPCMNVIPPEARHLNIHVSWFNY